MLNGTIAVFVPGHRWPLPADAYDEHLSLGRLGLVLGRYPILFCGPGSGGNLEIPDHCFATARAYNALLRSAGFWRLIAARGIEWLLIYQLDAYCFSDRLEEFVGRMIDDELDYIGAPIPDAIELWKGMPVGNGGFSLRRVNAHLQGAPAEWVGPEDEPWGEDYEWCRSGTLRIASFELACEFSWEIRAPELYAQLGHLPFGCHAWQRWDPEFFHWLLAVA